MRTILLLMLVATLISGCIGQTVVGTSSLSIRFTVDPLSIYEDETSTLFIDYENIGKMPLTEVSVLAFDTGPLKAVTTVEGKMYDCRRDVEKLNPKQIGDIECKLAASRDTNVAQQFTTVPIYVRGQFTKTLGGTVSVEILTLEELRQRERTGKLASQPSGYTFSDNNVQMDITFSKPSPFVSGDKVLARVMIRSVADGSLRELYPGKLSLAQPTILSDIGGKSMECSHTTVLYPERGVLPAITCEMIVPEIPEDYGPSIVFPITFDLSYTYEVRGSTSITLIKGHRS